MYDIFNNSNRSKLEGKYNILSNNSKEQSPFHGSQIQSLANSNIKEATELKENLKTSNRKRKRRKRQTNRRRCVRRKCSMVRNNKRRDTKE